MVSSTFRDFQQHRRVRPHHVIPLTQCHSPEMCHRRVIPSPIILGDAGTFIGAQGAPRGIFSGCSKCQTSEKVNSSQIKNLVNQSVN